MFLRVILGLGASFFLSGCATSSLFQPYPLEAAKYKYALASNNVQPVLPTLEYRVKGADKLLYLSERGRIMQLTGNFAASTMDFEEAIKRYSAEDDKARISASGLASGSASLFSNENAIPYNGEEYERIFLHQFQAFNYLAANDPSGAGVELRRAALAQRNLELQNEKKLDAAKTQAQEKKFTPPSVDTYSELKNMSSLIGNVKSAYQNPYTFFTSAVIWEAMGERNSALIDYKKALEMNPNNKMLMADVHRLDTGKTTPQGASIVIIFEDGFIPEKKAFEITFPDIHNDAVYSFAAPYYASENPYTPKQLTATLSSGEQIKTEVIANFGAMAAKSLRDNYPKLLVRQILRARVKYEMEKKANNTNPLAGFAATAYNIISERADLRSWLTLPNNAQAARVYVPSGNQQISLSIGITNINTTINVIAGRTTILRVFNFNGSLQTQTFQL